MNYSVFTNRKTVSINSPNVGSGTVLYTATRDSLIVFYGNISTTAGNVTGSLRVSGNLGRLVYSGALLAGGSLSGFAQSDVVLGSMGAAYIAAGETVTYNSNAGSVNSNILVGTLHIIEMD
jgi:hypothetical protein